ncbi:MAG TPA: hypothetical protein VFO10_09380 [Oligoflexus sp.]|uniref:hypothetical protein n=1 Tax=Oligoflexus sp. TaxID=1971216 RepID=UPI002D8113D8|nr:hypothetical protein [Oligoflexus sp.]HET9237451.1 hypothetical protein [Oligoflexus sp.]
MEDSSPLALSLARLNDFRRNINYALSALRVLRGGVLALCTFLLWAWVSPEAWGQQLAIFCVSLFVFLVIGWQKGLRPSSMSEWLLSLEMANPQSNKSAFQLPKDANLDPTWSRLVDSELERHKKEGWQLLISKGSSLLLPMLALVVLSQTAGQAWESALQSLERAALSLTYGARLRVVEGMPESDGQLIKLSSKTLELTVLEQNLVEVLVTAQPESAPSLQLKDSQGKNLQTFRLVKAPSPEGNETTGRFSVTFAITEDAQLFLSTISTSTPTAVIKVKRLPVPQVTLSSVADLEESWPDDKPLPLDIFVKAEHPLQSVQLVIKAGERTHKELVTEVLAQDKMELETSYNLPLETYMDKDEQELEIVAEAMDRAITGPLIGRSKPLIIKVVSAYGRYQQTLRTLAEAKKELDLAVQGKSEYNPKHLAELGNKAAKQAEDSPYFDGLDRHQIRLFQQTFESIARKPDQELTVQASEDLNRFLFEHESLDDRERDRDFFVAARTLSRLLEQKAEERKVPVDKVVNRMKNFLDERHRRWELRMQNMNAENRPQEWDQVQKKPFNQALSQIEKMDTSKPPQTEDALQKLSQTVESYRQWIEALESKEDQSRAEQEKQRQQGLANAQNQLRELQKRQSSVSTKLDKAAQREEKDLQESWASVRMDQNSNVKGTRELEAQLRSMSPTAGERMKAAVQAMEATIDSGNENKFADAESASDMAGRLLQQAESAARQSQRDNGKRGRRRRVTSDQYYGNQVAGGDVDLRRDYQVNRRYREDVLEDVRELKKRESSEETDSLLEDYLRKVIR